jgi:cation diffusion facilitator family transporter
MHTKSDILVSVSVIATLVSIKIGFPMLDTIVALAIAGFIAHAVFDILRESSNVLCDKAPLMAEEIRAIVNAVEGVKECHMIRTRGRADDIHLDLHVVVNPSMHVGRAHDITETIEKKIKEKISGVTDVVVHIEPK